MSGDLGLSLVPRISVNDEELSEELRQYLIEVRVDRALNLPGRCTLRFAAVLPLAAGKVGAKVEVRSPDDKEAVFLGTVAGIEIEHSSESRPVTTLLAYDGAHLLSGRSGTETYLQQDSAAIIRKIASRHKVTVEATGLKGSYEYLVQAGSDLEMVDVVASRCAADWWFAEDKLHVEVLKLKGPADLTISLPELERFRVRASSDHPDELSVVGWSSTDQKPLVGTASYDAAMLATDASFATGVVGSSAPTRPARTGGVPVATKEEADGLAAALLRSTVQGAVRVDGVGRGLWALGPATRFKITDAGDMGLNGTYLVTEVEHRYDPQAGSSTRFACGPHRPSGLVDVLARGSRSPVQHNGLLVGEVTNINDPRKEGRVKVKFLGLDDNQESNWARVLIPGAGDKRGSVTLPEVEDEVLVGFEGADLRKPIVLGGMFGSAAKIPLWAVEGGKVTSRRITSRTGHHLEFGDGTAKTDQHVEILLSDGKTRLRLGLDKSSLEIPDNVELTIQVGKNSSLVFDGKGKVELKGTEIKLTATTNVVVDAKANVEVKAGASAKVEGTVLDLKGKAKGSIDGGGMLDVKGGLVKIN